MRKLYNNISELIGHTPIMNLKNYVNIKNINDNIFAKLEFYNPLSSIKDRVALAMIEDAEKNKLIDKNTIIVEPTSGNTGIGLAGICASKGYRLILTMPENMSEQRTKILKKLGAEIFLTPAKSGMLGSIKKAEAIFKENKNTFMPRQFENPVNPYIHEKTTAMEILNDMNDKIDFFIAGVGTGGTISGIGKSLKKYDKDIKIIAVEPEESSVIQGKKANKHGIQGIGAGFIPLNLNLKVVDDVISVSTQEALKTIDDIAKIEGLLVGISSGAALCAAEKLINKQKVTNKNIIVIFPDTGERYL